MRAREKKRKDVEKLVALLKEYPTIGIANLENLPGAQLQKIRNAIRGKHLLIAAKKSTIHFTIEAIKDKLRGIEEIDKHVIGVPALVLSKEDPFRVYRFFQKNKSNAPAKPGQIAPKDIIIPLGPTPFTPGPMIGELGQLGIKAGVEGGKIVIKQDFVAAKKGEPIKDKIAALLSKFGIEPMEIALNIVGFYNQEKFYKTENMVVDENVYLEKITLASRWAFNLSVESCYPTKENIELLILKSNNEAIALKNELKQQELLLMKLRLNHWLRHWRELI